MLKFQYALVFDETFSCVTIEMLVGKSPSLHTAARFLASGTTKHLRNVEIAHQRTSVVWWLEYLIDRLWRRRVKHSSIFLRYGDGVVLHDVDTVGNLSKGNRINIERDILRRLIVLAEGLPFTTRVTFRDCAPTTLLVHYKTDPSQCAVFSLGDLITQTQEEQSNARYQSLCNYELEALEKILDGDDKPVPKPVHEMPLINEQKRASERIITLLGSPSRLYYVTLFFIGLWLCFFYLLFVRLFT